MSQDLKDKVTTYFRRMEDRDWDGVRALFSGTATVWHNDGKGDSTIDENIAAMKSQIGGIESMRYDITRQFSQPGEVLQQHVVHVATTDGTRGQVRAAVYFRFEDGLIDRVEVYTAGFEPSGDA